MTAAGAALVVVRSLGLLALLAPVALVAARATRPSADRAVALIAGGAAAVATLVAVGLILSAFSGVSPLGWLGGLAAVDGVLLWRQRPGRVPRLHVRPFRGVDRPRLSRQGAVALAVAALAAGLAATAVVLAVTSARRQQAGVQFTQLWALPRRTNPPTMRLGVADFEPGTTRYTVVARLAGQVVYSAPLRLRRGRSWTATVSLPRTPTPLLMRIAVYRGSSTSPYRTVNLWTPAF